MGSPNYKAIYISRSFKDSMVQKKLVTFGPFGGHKGNPWDDGKNTGIKQLIIYSGSAIESIQIEYDNNGVSKWSDKHGGEGGVNNTVKLDYPREYLLSIWGYYCSDSALESVQSLTFESNKNTYGPFGKEKGKYFKFPSTSGKIVGFHGRSGCYLDSFGAYFESFSNIYQPPLIVGPFGDYGGHQWDDGVYTGVKQIIIYAGTVVDSIQFEYDNNGESKWSDKHGESSGGDKTPVKFDDPGEYLVSISGYYSLESTIFGGIQSLTIQSSKTSYGPFGTKIGKYFKFPSPGGHIVGLHGRSGYRLHSIGAYCQIGVPRLYLSVGPFGGQGGNEWDDGKYSGVKQLIIYAGSVIDSIQFEYVDINGNSKWSDKHGKSQGGVKHTVNLDYPSEFLLSISVYYSKVYKNVVVRSLTIESNKKIYGSFGAEQGKCFKASQITGKIVGFHGRSGDCLYSIGAYVESL